jgi:hypothetical protein
MPERDMWTDIEAQGRALRHELELREHEETVNYSLRYLIERIAHAYHTFEHVHANDTTATRVAKLFAERFIADEFGDRWAEVFSEIIE